jgi:nitroreductase
MMMQNDSIRLLQSHRSIRSFTNEKVSQEQIENIVESGRWAPTSHHVQAYSIVVIQDQKKKDKLAELVGNQAYVAQCPVFFVICADFSRLKKASELHRQSFEVGGIEQVLVGAVDAALVAENMLVAARSYELGGVMIGGIRNLPDEVSELLSLPDYTFPVMGLCVGQPNQDPTQKPRLPEAASVHYEMYNHEQIDAALEEYDQEMKRYYTDRTSGKRETTWSEMMSGHFSTPKRAHLDTFLKKQGFLYSSNKD